ncbi:MAG: UDP-N-acetylmuramoyl-L-alanyl-D-glutamate--2,6-diaminopimelate ligase [Firmicutes bacterium]|nr:UDP-N-acetylmuramoyl-L-alanyl-D-glutamate--2,6-diaminopimelate ligase [Bacillota bacterium]
MRLQKVLEGLDYKLHGLQPEIGGICYDSRQVQPGDLFVAISGLQQDGHDFVAQAEERGAAAALVERVVAGVSLPQVVVENTRYALGVTSANFFDHPGQKVRVLGVTGTNGKTTTTFLAKSILEAAGYSVGLIGTIQTMIGDEVLESVRTTPESLELQRLLWTMAEKGVDFAVMEVSSHALELHRTAGLSFAGALFTNLTQDHLDFHPTMEDYFAAKAKLFTSLDGSAVLNIDDPWGRKLSKLCSSSCFGFAINEHAQFRACNIQLENAGVSYILDSEQGQIPITLQLTGQFNVYNSLGAAALCASQGVSLEQIKQGLEKVQGVPGRFERIANDRNLNVIVDYAHTPNGLENILTSARELVPQGRIILVFGAGGDRDKGKRPLMGEVAGKLADLVIITSDNPRSEDPVEICSSIEKGLLSTDPQAQYRIEVNRRVAIEQAVQLATANDLVIIAGKGHETYQEFAHGRVHFDDGEEVRRAIKELKY